MGLGAVRTDLGKRSLGRRIVALDLPNRFSVAQPKPPEVQPRGLRIAYVVDPCGVLWHFAERRPGKPHDY